MAHFNEWQNARVSTTNLAVVPVSKTINAVVGTTETLITRPGDERALVFRVEVGDFRVRPGDYRTKSVTFDATGGGVENEVTATAHGYQTGDGPFRLTESGTLPTGLATGTNYFVIRVDNNTFQLAPDYQNALDGAAVVFTTDGTPPNEIAGVPASPAATGAQGYNSTLFVAGTHILSAPDKLTVKGSAAGSRLLYWWL